MLALPTPPRSWEESALPGPPALQSELLVGLEQTHDSLLSPMELHQHCYCNPTHWSL